MDLDRLVRDSVSEGLDLEFKESLPGWSDADKREFLADVTSLANTVGGSLLFGIVEEDGVAKEVRGVPREGMDDAILRLESLHRDGVQPRIMSVRISPIDVSADRVVVEVRVPRSPQSPHMVTYAGGSRFYGRNSRGKHPLDVDELRSAFLASASAEERVERFRIERLLRIQAGDTPLPLGDGPRVVIHVLPLMDSRVDPTIVESLNPPIKPLQLDHATARYNLDGVVLYGPTEWLPQPRTFRFFVTEAWRR